MKFEDMQCLATRYLDTRLAWLFICNGSLINAKLTRLKYLLKFISTMTCILDHWNVEGITEIFQMVRVGFCKFNLLQKSKLKSFSYCITTVILFLTLAEDYRLLLSHKYLIKKGNLIICITY